VSEPALKNPARGAALPRAVRLSKLAEIRNHKMARSAHAYVRGSTAKFYAWLAESAGKVPQGPDVWICGDCHVGNLGPLADAKGHVAIQIRDLDQAVIGNPAHDIIRLGLSLASAARGSDLPGATTAGILEQLTAGYLSALRGNVDKQVDKSHRPASVQELLTRSVERRWVHLALERLESVKPRLPLGKHFWPLNQKEKAGIEKLLAGDEVRELVTSLQNRDSEAAVKLVDTAYWIKGCSSLGRLRYAAMLRVGKKNPSHCLLDIKEAVTAAAPRSQALSTPRDNAIRVVEGAKALSPNLGQRMLPARLLGVPVVVRELMPQDLKIEVQHLSREQAMKLAFYLGGIVGRAHGRQMNKADRAAWLATLGKARSATLDAPGWLWSCVVELLSIHEAAYLDHCRRFAA
jgi:uncharacterized protein (DUF2252 family)